MRKRRYEPQKCNGGKNVVIWDNKTGECIGFTAQIVGRLNLQEDTLNEQESKITALKEENEQLKKELEAVIGEKEKSDEQ